MSHVVLWFVSQAETRAEFAERSVAKLEKTIDDLEGIQHSPVVSDSTSTDTSNMSAAVNTIRVTNSFTDPCFAVGTELMTGWTAVLCTAVLTDEALMIVRTQSPLTQLLVMRLSITCASEDL